MTTTEATAVGDEMEMVCSAHSLQAAVVTATGWAVALGLFLALRRTAARSEPLFAAAVDRAVSILESSGVDITEPLLDFINPAMFSAMSGVRWLVLPATGPTRRNHRASR